MIYGLEKLSSSQMLAVEPVGSPAPVSNDQAAAEAACDLGYLASLIQALQSGAGNPAEINAEIQRIYAQIQSLGPISDPTIGPLVQKELALLAPGGVVTSIGEAAFLKDWQTNDPADVVASWLSSAVNADPNLFNPYADTNPASPDLYFSYIMFMSSSELYGSPALKSQVNQLLNQVDSQGTFGYQYIAQFLNGYAQQNQIPKDMIAGVLFLDNTGSGGKMQAFVQDFFNGDSSPLSLQTLMYAIYTLQDSPQ